MAIHTDLPIYRTGVQLLSLAVKAQQQMPRGVKRSLGDKIAQHCVEMLDLVFEMAEGHSVRGDDCGRLAKAVLAARAAYVKSETPT